MLTHRLPHSAKPHSRILPQRGIDMAKAGFVTIIGKPNVGKSTLMNTLIGQKLAITSYRPQTTRKQMRTVYTDERGQIVFLDTPGMLRGGSEDLTARDAARLSDGTPSKLPPSFAKGAGISDLCRTKLGGYMELAAESTLKEADLILLLVEAGNGAIIRPQDQAVLDLLKSPEAGIHTPVFLVINKVDAVKKTRILEYIETYRKAFPFREIIPVSARTGKGRDELLSAIFQILPEGEPFYDEDTVTDEKERDIVAEIIREKTLRLLQDEVPHGIAVIVDSMKYHEGRSGTICDISASIITEKDSHKGIIIGRNGEMLKKIGTAARTDIENLIDTHVNLKLWVKVRKDWRDKESDLSAYGYRFKDLKN